MCLWEVDLKLEYGIFDAPYNCSSLILYKFGAGKSLTFSNEMNSRLVFDLNAESAVTLLLLKRSFLVAFVKSYELGAGSSFSFSTFCAMGFWKEAEKPLLKSFFLFMTVFWVSYVPAPGVSWGFNFISLRLVLDAKFP